MENIQNNQQNIIGGKSNQKGPRGSSYSQKLYTSQNVEFGSINYHSIRLSIEKSESNDDVFIWLKRVSLDINISIDSAEELDTCVVQFIERKNTDLFHDLKIKMGRTIVDGTNQSGYSINLIRTSTNWYDISFSLTLPTKNHIFSPISYLNFKFFDSKKDLKFNIMSRQIMVQSSYPKTKKRSIEESNQTSVEPLSEESNNFLDNEPKKIKLNNNFQNDSTLPSFSNLFKKLGQIGHSTIQVLPTILRLPVQIPIAISSNLSNLSKQKINIETLRFPELIPIASSSSSSKEVNIVNGYESDDTNEETDEIDLNYQSEDDEIDLNVCYDD